jgi:hypothetical protein
MAKGVMPMPYNKHQYIVGLPKGLTAKDTP